MSSLVLVEQRGEVVVWTLNNPDKLNCLSAPLIARLKECFDAAATDSSVKAAVLTGRGRYFSAGADFKDNGLKPTLRLSTIHREIARINVGIFHPFIHFPKPLFIAANGPAVGGATTCMLLCDAVLASPSATFHTPFRQLGITPEGCSTITFKAKIGEANARRMLVEGEKLSAAEAARIGFVDELLEEGDDLVPKACDFARAWVAGGRGRLGNVAERDRVNKREGLQLANAMFSARFLTQQGVPGIIAWPLSPVLKLLAKL